jgi:hypothetical protein
MHLESSIFIERSLEQVGSFLANAYNTPKWDRGVAGIKESSSGVTGVGSEFDTIADLDAPDDPGKNGRMSYRIAEVDPDRHQCTVELTSRDGNARYFKTASWSFRGVSAQGGTLLTCSVDFVLRIRWMVLAPIFYLLRGAITKDLRRLKSALEAE